MMTPYGAWYAKKPNVTHFRVFGCLAYLHLAGQNKKKLDPKSESFVFVGYSEHSKSYKLYNPCINSIIVLRDLIFYEGGAYGHQKNHVEKSKFIMNGGILVDIDHEKPYNNLIFNATHSPKSPSSSYLVSSASPTSSPGPNRKVRSLAYIYERSPI